jgi:hypothetical protein
MFETKHRKRTLSAIIQTQGYKASQYKTFSLSFLKTKQQHALSFYNPLLQSQLQPAIMKLHSFILLAAFTLAFVVAFPQENKNLVVTTIAVQPDDSATSSVDATTISINPDDSATTATTISVKPNNWDTKSAVPTPALPTSQSSAENPSLSTAAVVTSPTPLWSNPPSSWTSSTITPPFMRPNHTATGFANATASAGGQANTGQNLGNGSGGNSKGGTIGVIAGAVGGVLAVVTFLGIWFCFCCRNRGSRVAHEYKTALRIEDVPLVETPKEIPPKPVAPEEVPRKSQPEPQPQSQSQSQVRIVTLTDPPASVSAPAQAPGQNTQRLPTQAQAPGGFYHPGALLPPNPYGYNPYLQGPGTYNYYPPPPPFGYQQPQNPYNP